MLAYWRAVYLILCRSERFDRGPCNRWSIRRCIGESSSSESTHGVGGLQTLSASRRHGAWDWIVFLSVFLLAMRRVMGIKMLLLSSRRAPMNDKLL